MAKLLDTLGDGYRYNGVSEVDLGTLKKLSSFDVLFLTCKPTMRMALVELKDGEDPKEQPGDLNNPLIQQILKQAEIEAKQQGVPFDKQKVMEVLKLLATDKKKRPGAE